MINGLGWIMTKDHNCQNEKGFTLIELLVVVAIIGLLASIAMVALNSARLDTRNTKRIADINQIAKALELYHNKYGAYPDNTATGYNEIDDIYFSTNRYFDSNCGADGNSDPFLTPLISEGFMSAIPNDPLPTGIRHCYMYTSNNLSGFYEPNIYYLIASIEPRTLGTEADKSCPGLDDNGPINGDYWANYPYWYCISQGGEINLIW